MLLNVENEAVIPINWYTTSKPTLYYRLNIVNNRNYTIYYKITTPQSDLVLSNNTGSISSATTGTVMFKIYFPIPSSPKDYIVNLNIGIYSDSSYNNMIDSGNFDLVVHFIDLNTVNVIGKWDFSDGTTQGWGNAGVNGTAFADPYSIATSTSSSGFGYVTSPSVTLPSTGNIWFIFAHKPSSSSTVRVYLSFGSTTIKDISNISIGSDQWYVFAIKITQGLGTTNSFKITFYLSTGGNYGLFDDIYIVSL